MGALTKRGEPQQQRSTFSKSQANGTGNKGAGEGSPGQREHYNWRMPNGLAFGTHIAGVRACTLRCSSTKLGRCQNLKYATASIHIACCFAPKAPARHRFCLARRSPGLGSKPFAILVFSGAKGLRCIDIIPLADIVHANMSYSRLHSPRYGRYVGEN